MMDFNNEEILPSSSAGVEDADAYLNSPPTVVIDNGSGYMKAGLSSDEQPSVVFPTIVGRPRRRFAELYAKGDGADGSSAVFVGEEAIANRHHLSFTYPIDHGHIDNWVDMEEVWNKTYSMLGVQPSEHALLVTEPPLCSLRHREKMAEMFFETYNAPELNISVTGLMAIYGTGRTTGFVLDIGEGITQCVPVFDGYLEKASVKRSDFGGQELQMYLQKILCDMGYPMTTRDDYEHVRVIKETLCFCSLNPAEDQNREDLEKTYHLPDGLTLRDGVTTKVLPPEALFNPQLCGRDNPSLIDLVWSSIMACPIESRKSLVGSIVLSGGSSMFPGFPERLEQELKNTSPPQARPHVHVLSHPSRGSLVWQGARLYCQPAMRPMQDHLWISRQEWDEIGMKIVAKKAALRITS
ncbi:actin like protein ALP1 [Besnoitia besnoiti]|uniref:Actin like protein ALP1 n=2 Tax=Sarcocystidae TaxID=5809 RepID=A0A2A9MGA8_BESBE|nr:actin like protein ALP1 [Besnoitia besnoiti]PFH37538.1 actin like protein ALP1 [Besnoitia besnoiti]